MTDCVSAHGAVPLQNACQGSVKALNDPTLGVRATLVGSFRRLDLPDEFEALFSGDVLIDPRNGTPMEMDGYSAYLVLKALEVRTGRDYRRAKLRLTEAVVQRLEGASPPFWHGGWARHPDEVHLRFTAAAVRLLGEATKDGLLTDRSALSRVLNYHLSFRDDLASGRWFLHDSFEMRGASPGFPFPRSGEAAWGASEDNNLVLNTHLDTISTILAVAPLLPDERLCLISEVDAGLRALELAITALPPPRWFRLLDNRVRYGVFASGGWRFRGAYRLRAGFVRRYFAWRAKVRSGFPGFVAGDGYLDRDVRLTGAAFHYHLVNIADLSRLVAQLRHLDRAADRALIARCGTLVSHGISYAITDPFRREMMRSTDYDGVATTLCETILLTLANTGLPDIPKDWLETYCTLRRCLPPTAALLGYDPFVVQPNSAAPALAADRDDIVLRDGRRLTIDIQAMTCTWH